MQGEGLEPSSLIEVYAYEQAASPPLVEDPLTATSYHSRSTIFARWRQCRLPSNTQFPELTHHLKLHLNHCSPGLMPHSIYTLHCASPFVPKFSPFHGKIWTPIPHIIHHSLCPADPSGSSITSAIFCTIHGCYQWINRLTEGPQNSTHTDRPLTERCSSTTTTTT